MSAPKEGDLVLVPWGSRGWGTQVAVVVSVSLIKREVRVLKWRAASKRWTRHVFPYSFDELSGAPNDFRAKQARAALPQARP